MIGVKVGGSDGDWTGTGKNRNEAEDELRSERANCTSGTRNGLDRGSGPGRSGLLMSIGEPGSSTCISSSSECGARS